MKFFETVVLFCFLCCASAQISYKSKSLCTTRFGTKSVIPKSTGYAVTVPVTYRKKVTVTPTKTVTPPAVSKTITTTSMSNVFVTSMTNSTVTNIETATLTTIETSTITLTETSTGSAITISSTTTSAAPAGFTPLRNDPKYVPKKRSRIEARQVIKYTVNLPRIGGQPVYSPQRYPTATTCVTLVQAITTSTKTFTASATTKTLPALTSTATKTVTYTATTTIIAAPLLVTTTSSTTVGTTSTTTITTTTTFYTTPTIEAPVSTEIAQCQSNNIVGGANGNQGIYTIGASGVSSVNMGPTDSYGCCVACSQTSGCAGYYSLGSGCEVFVANPNTCSGADRQLYFYTSSGFPANAGFIVGNGQCGGLENRGAS